MALFADMSKLNFSLRELERFAADVAGHYEKTAPMVESWADSICERIGKSRELSIFETLQFLALYENAEWEHPNYAANRCYKVNSAMGRDAGVISF